MSKYQRNYSVIDNPLAADAAAIQDIRDYLGLKAYGALMEYIKKDVPCHHIAVELAFCGVQGFPIFAFLRTYKPKEEYDAWYASLPVGE